MPMQDAGILVVLNEMALALGLFVIFAARICKVPAESFKEIREPTAMGIRSAARVGVENVNGDTERMQTTSKKH